MAVKVGISGFGRIGRLVFRVMAQYPEKFDVVAINDLFDADMLAYMLRYDSTQGRFHGKVVAKQGAFVVNKATEDAMGLDRQRLLGTDFSSYFTEPHKAAEGLRTLVGNTAGVIRQQTGAPSAAALRALLLARSWLWRIEASPARLTSPKVWLKLPPKAVMPS